MHSSSVFAISRRNSSADAIRRLADIPPQDKTMRIHRWYVRTLVSGVQLRDSSRPYRVTM